MCYLALAVTGYSYVYIDIKQQPSFDLIDLRIAYNRLASYHINVLSYLLTSYVL